MTYYSFYNGNLFEFQIFYSTLLHLPPLGSSVSEDAGNELRTVATLRRSNHLARSLLLLFIKPPTAGHHQLKGLKKHFRAIFLYTNYNMKTWWQKAGSRRKTSSGCSNRYRRRSCSGRLGVRRFRNQSRSCGHRQSNGYPAWRGGSRHPC